MSCRPYAKLVQKCEQNIYWRFFKIVSPFCDDKRLTRDLSHQVVRTSLLIHNKIIRDIETTKIFGNNKVNNDAVLAETLIFMSCFTQAGLKRSMNDLWEVPSFKKILEEPIMRIGSTIVDNLISQYYYDPTQDPHTVALIRIGEYFKKGAIDRFISNLVGAILAGELLHTYKYVQDPQSENLQKAFNIGFGKILADHEISSIRIAGKSA